MYKRPQKESIEVFGTAFVDILANTVGSLLLITIVLMVITAGSIRALYITFTQEPNWEKRYTVREVTCSYDYYAGGQYLEIEETRERISLYELQQSQSTAFHRWVQSLDPAKDGIVMKIGSGAHEVYVAAINACEEMKYPKKMVTGNILYSSNR
jgi:hypothetical protein